MEALLAREIDPDIAVPKRVDPAAIVKCVLLLVSKPAADRETNAITGLFKSRLPPIAPRNSALVKAGVVPCSSKNLANPESLIVFATKENLEVNETGRFVFK